MAIGQKTKTGRLPIGTTKGISGLVAAVAGGGGAGGQNTVEEDGGMGVVVREGASGPA